MHVTKCLASVEVWYLGTSIYLLCQYYCIMHIAFHIQKSLRLLKKKEELIKGFKKHHCPGTLSMQEA